MPDAVVEITGVAVDEWPNDPDIEPGTALNVVHFEKLAAIFSLGAGPVCINCTDQIYEVPAADAPAGPPEAESRVIPLSTLSPDRCWVHESTGNVYCDGGEDATVWAVDPEEDPREHAAWPDPGISSWLRSITLEASDEQNEIRLTLSMKEGRPVRQIIVRREDDGSASITLD